MYILGILFVVAAGVQVIYLSLFLIAFYKKRKTEGVAPPSVSVIVCAHDEENNIKELVPLLLAQDHPAFEVIVVEDRSNDNTFDYLLGETKKNDRIRMVRVQDKPEHINGKKFALTLGIKAARYDWVLLTDADCRPASNSWISEMSKYFTPDAGIVLGYSPYQKTQGLLNSFIRYESLVTGFQFIGFAILGKPYMGVGRNLAYRKMLFLENKGFNKHLGVTGGDDDLFVNRLATKQNTRVSLGHEALVYSIPKKSWKEFFHQKLRHLSVGRLYAPGDKIMLGGFSVSLILFWILLVPAATVNDTLYVTACAFSGRFFLHVLLTHRASREMGDSFESWKAPFLDIIFAFYYLVTGLIALQTKKIRWKRT